jgi:HSP20 family molecular chaperone IbpA|tara:strand:+ start:25940 stop:26278 length:339 start_codon:yes stop_codon:yes gene_type:complete
MNTLINTILNDLTYTLPVYPRSRGRISSVKDSGDVYTSEVELAGFAKKDIKITIADDAVNIEAENKERSKQFKLHLNSLVSVDHITAELKNGLLKLVLPKTSVKEGREVTIK